MLLNKFILKKLLLLLLYFIINPFNSTALELNPKKLSFGVVKHDSKIIEKKIKITHKEFRKIILKKVRSSCTCFEINFEKDSKINFKQNTIVSIKFIPYKLKKKGKFKKRIFFEFEDNISPLIIINVYGEII